MIFIKTLFLKYLKGILIGIGATIPGVSGGTVAILTGEFETLIEAVGNIHLHIKKSLLSLLPVIFGAITGLFIISFPMDLFCEKYPIFSKYTFCFISTISAIFFIYKTKIYKVIIKQQIYIILGCSSALLISVSLTFLNINLLNSHYLLMLLLGMPLSLALVLPAISFSYTLVYLGIYERTLNAILNFDIPYLLCLGLGVIIGMYISSKLLLKLIKSYPNEIFCLVFGFLIFSVFEIIL